MNKSKIKVCVGGRSGGKGPKVAAASSSSSSLVSPRVAAAEARDEADRLKRQRRHEAMVASKEAERVQWLEQQVKEFCLMVGMRGAGPRVSHVLPFLECLMKGGGCIMLFC